MITTFGRWVFQNLAASVSPRPQHGGFACRMSTAPATVAAVTWRSLPATSCPGQGRWTKWRGKTACAVARRVSRGTAVVGPKLGFETATQNLPGLFSCRSSLFPRLSARIMSYQGLRLCMDGWLQSQMWRRCVIGWHERVIKQLQYRCLTFPVAAVGLALCPYRFLLKMGFW